MSPHDEQQILQNAREAIARVIDQLDRDRSSLAGKPQYAAGEQKVVAAKATAVRLSQTLQNSTAEHS